MLELLSNKFKVINFEEFNSKVTSKDIENYYWLKSYRSNLTEGNTTTDDSFTKIMKNKNSDELISKTFDEQYEIINLRNAYLKFSKNDLSINHVQNINRVLGVQIFKNNFNEYKGKFRNNSVIIATTINGEQYRVEFSNHLEIKHHLKQLINKYINTHHNNDMSLIFALNIILHNELINIHPFVDGNGRTTRAVIEIELEKNNIFPYIPFDLEKREYQQAMSQFSINGQADIIAAYDKFGDYILENYNNNMHKIINKLQEINEI